jgi:predicted transcriptional regulator
MRTTSSEPSIMTATAKQDVEQLLQQLPDDATLEDIQYHVYVLEKIRHGRADIAAGRRYTTDEARERLGRWLQR